MLHLRLITPADRTDAAAQKSLIKPSGHQGTDSLSYPDKAQFDKARKGVVASQVPAAKELALLEGQAATARKAVATAETAENAAYAIADERGGVPGSGHGVAVSAVPRAR